MNNNKKITIIAVLLGLITSLAVYYYLQTMKAQLDNRSYGPTVVAKADIPAKTVITPEMLETVDLPKEYIHPQAMSQVKDLIGAVTLNPIVKGEVVLNTRIVRERESKGGLAFAVPQGKRAVTVALDDVKAVGGMVRPGDRVDVLATLDIPIKEPDDPKKETPRPHTLVVIQDAEILAVGRETESVKVDGQAKSDAKGDNKGQGIERRTVTLSVTLTQAEPLILANERGSVRLALRSPVDKGKIPTQPFELRDFLKGDKLPATGVN